MPGSNIGTAAVSENCIKVYCIIFYVLIIVCNTMILLKFVDFIFPRGYHIHSSFHPLDNVVHFEHSNRFVFVAFSFLNKLKVSKQYPALNVHNSVH